MISRISAFALVAFFGCSAVASPLCVQRYERHTAAFQRCMAEQGQYNDRNEAQMAMNSVVDAIKADTRLSQALRDQVDGEQRQFISDIVPACRKTSDAGQCIHKAVVDRTVKMRKWYAVELKKLGH